MVVKTEPKDTSIPAQTIPQARQKRTASKEEKSNALKEVADYRKAVAWQVHRWPLEKRLVQEKTKIHLPMSYHATAGVEVKTIWPGDDLNQVVHRYYAQRLTEDDEGKLKARNCTNFVTDDGLTLQRYVFGVVLMAQVADCAAPATNTLDLIHGLWGIGSMWTAKCTSSGGTASCRTYGWKAGSGPSM